jgi:alkanesulfonate monooxygenase SsuD/methylene tetrahydromethanopterin reductase-like flavin-dependent oxidoreductase (luciferase family)
LPIPDVIFGFGAHSDIAQTPGMLRTVEQADRDGLDIFSLSDHPYFGERLDAYASIGFILGRTSRISGLANVTNLPTRPAPMLARTVTSLSTLSGGRIVLGMGAGGLWDRIADMGVQPLAPGAAVDAFEEAIILVRLLSGRTSGTSETDGTGEVGEAGEVGRASGVDGGQPVSYQGRHYYVREIAPAPAAAPPVWTGSVGAKSLAATGRVADGWIPGHAADWLSERYRTSRPAIDEAAATAGRDPREIRTVFNFPGRITDRPLAAPRDEDGHWIGGSAGQWVEELTRAVLEHGAGGFILFAPGGGAQDIVSLGRWASEVVPAVREAIAKGSS